MKYGLFIAIICLVLLAAACKKPATLNIQNTQTTNQSGSNTILSNSSEANVNGTPDVQTTAGQYLDYSDSVIADTSGQKILFFHAAWCPQCRRLEQSIKTGRIPENVTIIKADYDSMQSLRQRYGVTLQTTVVLVGDDGKLIKKFVAYDDPSLDRVIRELL